MSQATSSNNTGNGPSHYVFFFFQTHPKNLYLSYMMDLDFWYYVRMESHILYLNMVK